MAADVAGAVEIESGLARLRRATGLPVALHLRSAMRKPGARSRGEAVAASCWAGLLP